MSLKDKSAVRPYRRFGLFILLVLLYRLVYGQTTDGEKAARPSAGLTKTMPGIQDPLFEADLQGQPDVPQAVPTEGHDGKLVGNGNGTIRGPRVKGTLRWSNFEKPGENLCEMNLAGIITTEDGASIKFESKGYALLSKPPKWETAGGMHFSTEDKRYEWLNQLLANWRGSYDPATSHARFSAFAVSPRPVNGKPRTALQHQGEGRRDRTDERM